MRKRTVVHGHASHKLWDTEIEAESGKEQTAISAVSLRYSTASLMRFIALILISECLEPLIALLISKKSLFITLLKKIPAFAKDGGGGGCRKEEPEEFDTQRLLFCSVKILILRYVMGG